MSEILRGVRRLPYVELYIFKMRLRETQRRVQKPFFIFRRSLFVIRPFLGLKFRVYSGRYSRVFIFNVMMLGFRFGEYMFTRKFGRGEVLHMRRKKAKK